MVVKMNIRSKYNSLSFNKILLLLFLFIVIILLSSCDYSYYLFYSDDKEVTSIELINYAYIDTDEQIEAAEYNFNNVEILETLSEDDIEVLIDELSKIGGISSKYKNIKDNPSGFGILILYEDNSFTIITVDENSETIYLGEYNSELKRQDYFGIARPDMIVEFQNLIEEYFQITDNLIS